LLLQKLHRQWLNFTIFLIQPVKRSTYDILFFPKNQGKVIKKKKQVTSPRLTGGRDKNKIKLFSHFFSVLHDSLRVRIFLGCYQYYYMILVAISFMHMNMLVHEVNFI
jgi:hypothetical protein